VLTSNHTLSLDGEDIVRAIMSCGPSTSRQIAEATGIDGQSLGGNLASLLSTEMLQQKQIEGYKPRYWLGPESLKAIGGIHVPNVGYVDLSAVPRSWFQTTLKAERALPHLEGCADMAIVLCGTGDGLVVCERLHDLLVRETDNALGTSATGHHPDLVLFRKGRKPRAFEYERSDKSPKEGDPILIGWTETDDVEVTYVTARRRAILAVFSRVEVISEHMPELNVADAITILPMEGNQFPSRRALIGKASTRKRTSPRAHNASGRPRTVRGASKSAAARKKPRFHGVSL
jgi:hypothetical protein